MGDDVTSSPDLTLKLTTLNKGVDRVTPGSAIAPPGKTLAPPPAATSTSTLTLPLKDKTLDRELGTFVEPPLKQDSDSKTFFEITRLLLIKSEMLCNDTKFLNLVSVTNETSLATTCTPKNVIIYILDFLQHSIKSQDSNQNDLRNVLKLLNLIFSFGPELPPIDRYFETGAKGDVTKYNALIKNVSEFTQLFKTDEFLNKISNDVIHIYNSAAELIGGSECRELIFQVCRFIRCYDPSLRHFDTPIANLFRIPISHITSNSLSPTNITLILRLISASPSLYIDLDETPQPKLELLVSHLKQLHHNLDVCLAMTSCLYRLFIVSEQTLDACLDDKLITALMEEFAFMVKNFRKNDDSRLLRMVFEVLKCMTSPGESKIIISGQPSIIVECTDLINECVFESIFAVRFLACLSEFLPLEAVTNAVRAISHCTDSIDMRPELGDYFCYVTLQFLVLSQEDGGFIENRIGAKELIEIASKAILELSQDSVLQYSLKVVNVFLEEKELTDVITKEFISALTRLFLESVSQDREDLVGLFSYLLSYRVMEAGGKEVMKMVLSSDLVPQVVKLFLSEERCEHLAHYSKLLKCAVISYEGAGLEFEQLEDKALADKMAGLLIGKYFTIEENTPSEMLNHINADVISCLWSFSCNTHYVTHVLVPSHTISYLLQVIRGCVEKLEELIQDSYHFRAAAHILCNVGIKKETYKLEIAETGIHRETYQLLIQLLEYNPVPWSPIDAALRLTDILTSDEILKLELVDYGYVETLTRMLTLQPNSTVMIRSFDALNTCAFISADMKENICSVSLLEFCADLLKRTSDGRLFCICCGLLTTLSDVQTGAKMVSQYDIFPHLLSTPEDEQLVASCNQVGRWALNLVDKVVLNCVNTDMMTSQPIGEAVELNELVRDGNFIVNRMMGMIRQGCMNCEGGEGESCTQSDSLNTEEICFHSSSLTLLQYQQLVNRGWYRRGGDRMYRWGIKLREKCLDWETRVRVKEFSLKQRKTFLRVMKKIPSNLTVDTVPARFSEEGYTLYNEYNLHKHDKSRVSRQSYIEHVVDTCVPTVHSESDGISYGTFHQEYRVAGELIAIGIIDIIPEGVISIYFYYKMRHDVTKLSLGKYSSLREIQLVQELSSRSNAIKYYYLQGWNGGNKKLSYKSDYAPAEFLSRCVNPDWTQDAAVPDEQVHFSAKEIDILNSPPLDSKVIRVWINGNLITFQHLLDVAKLSSEVSEIISKSLDQLCYAIGPELTSQMVLVFHTSHSHTTC